MIVLTRSEPGASKTANMLKAAGFETIVTHHLIAFKLAEDADVKTSATDIIVTSANGVRACQELGMRPDDRPVWCVGEATALAAKGAGWDNIQTSAGNAKSLLAYILSKSSKSSKKEFVHFANAAATDEVVQGLKTVGFEARKISVYHMLPQLSADLPNMLAQRSGAVRVVFHSAMAARTFAECVKCADKPDLDAHSAYVYAKPIADPLENIFSEISVLPEPHDKALMQALLNP